MKQPPPPPEKGCNGRQKYLLYNNKNSKEILFGSFASEGGGGIKAQKGEKITRQKKGKLLCEKIGVTAGGKRFSEVGQYEPLILEL